MLSWNVFGGFQFVAFFIYLMAAYAETNRAPFDLPEAESELVAGYHTEYSSMKFAMFFMAEYANMITVELRRHAALLRRRVQPLRSSSPDDFGGPVLAAIFPIFWFVVKVLGFLLLYIWVRGTLPRFRYDQLMSFGWKFLLPLAMANIVVTSLVDCLAQLSRNSVQLFYNQQIARISARFKRLKPTDSEDYRNHHATGTLSSSLARWRSQEHSTSCCSATPSTAHSRWSSS